MTESAICVRPLVCIARLIRARRQTLWWLQVDRALDASNLMLVANYMRQATRPDVEHCTQGVLISHKDALYQKADALVGVTKSLEGTGSAVYTLDLERFGEPQE